MLVLEDGEAAAGAAQGCRQRELGVCTGPLLPNAAAECTPAAALNTSPRALPTTCRSLSEATKRLAAKRILSRVSEAYGRMLLLDGLFQADGHPGNILVMKRAPRCFGFLGFAFWLVAGGRMARKGHGACAGSRGVLRTRRSQPPGIQRSRAPTPQKPTAGGKIGLIDYGQSKRLPDAYRAAFAQLVRRLGARAEQGQFAAPRCAPPAHPAGSIPVFPPPPHVQPMLLPCQGVTPACARAPPPQVLAMDGGDEGAISAALDRIGVVTPREDAPLKARLAYSMFDTRGK